MKKGFNLILFKEKLILLSFLFCYQVSSEKDAHFENFCGDLFQVVICPLSADYVFRRK